MLEAIKAFFESHLQADHHSPEEDRHQLNLAAAALMVELIETDQRLDERETETFLKVLQDTFLIQTNELENLVQLSREQAHQATSLYQFTRLINDNYDYERKLGLIAALWRLAFADNSLDKYEESLIRQVAELMHVSHSDFILTKLRVLDSDSG